MTRAARGWFTLMLVLCAGWGCQGDDADGGGPDTALPGADALASDNAAVGSGANADTDAYLTSLGVTPAALAALRGWALE